MQYMNTYLSVMTEMSLIFLFKTLIIPGLYDSLHIQVFVTGFLQVQVLSVCIRDINMRVHTPFS